jgi:hypothetical protein
VDTTTLNGWSLDITAVPEPVNVALGIFAGLAGVVGLARLAVRKWQPAKAGCSPEPHLSEMHS